MENIEHRRHRVWSIPYVVLCPFLAAIFWIPAYFAIHVGQITPLLTLLFAVGIGRSPFVRGLIVGFVSAIKPTFGLMLPFLPISFGWKSAFGIVVGVLPALISPYRFMEYLGKYDYIANRHYDVPGMIQILGYSGSIAVTSIACLGIAIRWRGQEASYIGILAAVVLGTALWSHSYTPLIVPLVWWITVLLDPNPSESVHSNQGESDNELHENALSAHHDRTARNE